MASPPRLVFLLNSAQRRLQQWTAAEQDRAALAGEARTPSPVQSGVLFTLAHTDGATMGQLASALDLAPSAVSGLVQRMETLGWLLRSACPLDARTQRVWLQPAGQAQLPALKLALKRVNQRLTQGFSDTELHTVARWLRHVQQLGEHGE